MLWRRGSQGAVRKPRLRWSHEHERCPVPGHAARRASRPWSRTAGRQSHLPRPQPPRSSQRHGPPLRRLLAGGWWGAVDRRPEPHAPPGRRPDAAELGSGAPAGGWLLAVCACGPSHRQSDDFLWSQLPRYRGHVSSWPWSSQLPPRHAPEHPRRSCLFGPRHLLRCQSCRQHTGFLFEAHCQGISQSRLPSHDHRHGSSRGFRRCAYSWTATPAKVLLHLRLGDQEHRLRRRR
mmetsp:Transcript_117917/g.279865  ORF Transcript_117917/g.279865 Transcript_117917/m.279865 type:complete len:234 (-) Transcript_117917:735-1436(-)